MKSPNVGGAVKELIVWQPEYLKAEFIVHG